MIAGAILIGGMALLGGPSRPPEPEGRPGAELIWPDDPAAPLLEAAEAHRTGAPAYPSWPRPVADICGTSLQPRENPLEPAVAPPPALRDFCREHDHPSPFRLRGAFGPYAPARVASRGVPFETFEGSWGSTRTDPELARSWTRMPPAFGVELRHAFSARAFLHFRAGLRRDLSAWRRDPAGLNLPLSVDEVDLNEPSFGYFHYEGGFLAATIGRFPLHWAPDRDFGLTLSDAVPYHNGFQAVLKLPRARYRFFVSSLNPWLEGTPPGDTASTDFPVGSEQWRQRNYPVLPGTQNAHKRVYAEPVKTLIAHRIEAVWGPAGFGITETQVIGGKVPDLRDANPFAVFHNDFHEGYANNNVAVDFAWRLPRGFRLSAEAFADDIKWAPREDTGAAPAVLGLLATVRHTFTARGWTVSHALHAVRTDPYLYGYPIPLNTYASRHVLATNDQQPGDPRFVDRYVIDYPLGYLRGGDALDFWYRSEAARGRSLRLSMTAGLLARGAAGLHSDFEGYYSPHGSAPTAPLLREFRILAAAGLDWRHGLSATGGLGLRRLSGDRRGEARLQPLFSLGLTWSGPD